MFLPFIIVITNIISIVISVVTSIANVSFALEFYIVNQTKMNQHLITNNSVGVGRVYFCLCKIQNVLQRYPSQVFNYLD